MTTAWLAILLLNGPLATETTAPDGGLARLVSFAELEDRLGRPNLRVLDARPRAEYDQGHIPGAVWVDAKAVEAMAAKPDALDDRAAWEAWLSPLGIRPDSEVLVYDASRQLDAARVWWLLGYLGVEQVGLLDGNFPLWASENRPVTAEVPTVEPRPFKVAFRADRHATRADVLAALAAKSDAVIDARSDGEYVGADKRASRSGHIPTACHLEWNNFVDKNGRFLDEAALRAKLTNAGLAPTAPVITHCHGGGRASVNAFVLERLGFKTRNYYLGWSDWGNVKDTPVNGEGSPKRAD